MQQKNYTLDIEFNKYRFLAVSIASRYKNYNIEHQDLVQASYLGLITGLNKCSIIEEKHKVNYLSKYILGEIINTLKSHNLYYYNKDYFKTVKLIKENEDLSINELVDKFKLNRSFVIDILVNDKKEVKEEVSDNNYHYFSDIQKQIYNLVVLRNYSITKTSKLLNKKRNYLIQELKEIYNLIKK